MVRVRFAPSLSGNLHLGSIRTALANYYYAKANSGELILRIDDLNESENKVALEQITEDLNWLGIKYNAIVKQTERESTYHAVLEKLIATNQIVVNLEHDEKIYYFKSPKGRLVVSDLVFTQINGLAPSYVILAKQKKDGTWRYFYNFVSVVDDLFLEITHVIRGADHLSNTLTQIGILRSVAELFNYKVPTFGHLPNVFFKGAKMSKKLHATIKDFRKDYILPKTLVELTNLTDLSKQPKANYHFDPAQLIKLNCKHLKQLTVNEAETHLQVSNLTEPIWALATQKFTDAYELRNLVKDLTKALSSGDFNYALNCSAANLNDLADFAAKGTNTAGFNLVRQAITNRTYGASLTDYLAAFELITLQKIATSLTRASLKTA